MKSLLLPPHWHHEAHASVASTLLCCNAAALAPGDFLLVTAEEQTAGRGQRGTTWESQRGANLTFTVGWRDVGVLPRNQFLISEVCALAVACTVEELLRDAGNGEAVSVKWPNDVYVGERKICGMLIEHSLTGGRIDSSMAGIGININQTRFTGDTPNPVSLKQLTGLTYPRERVMERFVGHFMRGIEALQAKQYERVEQDFAARLFRRTGWHNFRDAEGMFSGELVAIARNGILTLRKADGTTHDYAFKEVNFCL